MNRLLCLSITCRLFNSKANQQMRFSLPSIKCSVAPPSFRLCWLNWAQQCDLITAHLTVVRSSEEPQNNWLTVAKNTFVSWPLNIRVHMLLKGAVSRSYHRMTYINITMIQDTHDVTFEEKSTKGIRQGLKLTKKSSCNFVTRYENLVAVLQILVTKLLRCILLSVVWQSKR